MLTAKRLFLGETVTDTLAAVIEREPDLARVPPKVRKLLKSCLEKDPRKRLRDIGDVWRQLEEAPESPRSAPARQWWWPAAAAVLLVIAAVLAFVHFREQPPAAEAVRFALIPPEGNLLSADFAVSPDGRQVAYVASAAEGVRRILVRRLDALESRALPGTEQAFGLFWSPDSRFLGFFASGQLKKIDIAGGPPLVLCDATAFRGGSWGRDGVIVFGSQTTPIMRVSASGGVPSPVTAIDASRQEAFHAAPYFLPNGRNFLYLRYSPTPANFGIYLGSLDAKPEQQDQTRLLNTEIGAVFAPSSDPDTGHILFLRGSTLMAQEFDARDKLFLGEPVALAQGVGFNARLGFFSIAKGVLAYRSGTGARSRLVWLDREGKILGRYGEPAVYWELTLSPDGSRVAVERGDIANSDTWLVEFTRGATTRLTFGPGENWPGGWSPDGKQVVFSSSRSGQYDIYRKPSNGAGEDELLFKSEEPKYPVDISRDGRTVLYVARSSKTSLDLRTLPLEGERKPVPFLETRFDETMAQFSPDDRWIAYVSDESGRQEVYVQPFPRSPARSGKWLISSNGGYQPRWRADGRELLYLSPDSKLMSVEVNGAGASFQAGTPKALFTAEIQSGPVSNGITHRWDVAPDGKRFLFNSPLDDSTTAPITVVLNWEEGLKK
jgi:Tol biopolymer transport system component